MKEQPAQLDPADPLAWDRYAACRKYTNPNSPDYNPELSWCGERAQARPEEKRICMEECPVRRECLTWSITQTDPHCVYGGYNFGQRRRIAKQWKEAGILPDPELFPRISPDPEEMFRIFTEGTTREMSAANYEQTRAVAISTVSFDVEPTLEELQAIEEEE